jgi:hypothetical protein
MKKNHAVGALKKVFPNGKQGLYVKDSSKSNQLIFPLLYEGGKRPH